MKKTFSIAETETNKNWVSLNLDDRDYEIKNESIHITYYHEFQKTDILLALPKS